jgi:3-hydroxyacyl-[acyl-carrier-protein] dehydratase
MSDETTKPDRSAVLDRVKTIMRRDLKLGSDITIDESTPFVGGEADIDSLDILLMVASVEREFGMRITNEDMGRRMFQNVGTLTDYVFDQMKGNGRATDVLQRLPHGPPFRFVSRLTAIEPGKSAQGIWSVAGSEDFFKGHFPDRPIVPGVLIAEALAQISGLAANIANSDGRLAQVDVRFDGAVVPPAEIQLRTRLTRQIGALTLYEVEASCGSTIVARGNITLSWTGAK